MTLISFQNGQPILRGGLVGTGQACCCGGCSGPCASTEDCAPGCTCFEGQCSKCECPPCEFIDSLCISASYTIRGCSGTFSDEDFVSLCEFEVNTRYAEEECGEYGAIAVFVSCSGGLLTISAAGGPLSTPEGCFDTSPTGSKTLCLQGPDYEGIFGTHTFDIALGLFDTGNDGACAGQVIGSATVTISEPPC